MKTGIRRSKGCRTCRARRVGCDEARPTCGRCQRSMLQCEGYDEETVFIIETTGHAQQALTKCKCISPSAITAKMVRPAAETYYIGFMVDKLGIEKLGEESGFSWLSMGLKTADVNSMEYISSRSLAEAFFGRYFHLPDVTRDAEISYGHLLRTLRKKLRAGNSLHETSLLLVILTSAVFEIVLRPGHENGWEAHTKGLSQIIQVRGPKAFQHPGPFALFEAARSFIITEGIKNNHEIFLDQEQWKTKPTSMRSKAWQSTLGDIAGQLPGLAAEMEEWRRTNSEANELKGKVVHILQELFGWRWNWEIAHGGRVEEIMTDPRSRLCLQSNGTPLFTKFLKFENNSLASSITSYDAALIYLLNTAEELLGKNWQQYVDVEIPAELSNNYMYLGSLLLLPSDLPTVSQVFEEMFKTIEGQLDRKTAVPGDAFRLLLPMFVAGRGLHEDCAEARYIQKAMEEMANITGFAAFDRRWKEDGRYFKPSTTCVRASL